MTATIQIKSNQAKQARVELMKHIKFDISWEEHGSSSGLTFSAFESYSWGKALTHNLEDYSNYLSLGLQCVGRHHQ